MNQQERFEQLVVPHLDKAYNLARWLLKSDASAEDAVQDAALKAFRHIGRLQGEDARPWLLGIVRNTCFTALEKQRNGPQKIEFEAEDYYDETADDTAYGHGPYEQLEKSSMRAMVDAAVRALPPHLREVIILREFEELDYAEISRISGIPIGTVMSRLSRARSKLRDVLAEPAGGR